MNGWQVFSRPEGSSIATIESKSTLPSDLKLIANDALGRGRVIGQSRRCGRILVAAICSCELS